mmetsp:Transcript_40359/g.58997  ORF Transcript_40359/g.58997 Transcript_40359/m.58997 type:complete len:86 (-) Transcript_40359:177-434(-)
MKKRKMCSFYTTEKEYCASLQVAWSYESVHSWKWHLQKLRVCYLQQYICCQCIIEVIFFFLVYKEEKNDFSVATYMRAIQKYHGN